MPQLIKTSNQYLEEVKKDIYILKLIDQSNSMIFFESDLEDNKNLIEDVMQWFDDNNIKYYMTSVTEGLLCGWDGWFYIEFTNEDQIKAYCQKHEDETGKSLEPKKYQMFIKSYDEYLKRRDKEELDTSS